MIVLTPPVRSVRYQHWGITKRVETPTWGGVTKYGISQGFGDNSGPLQEFYKSIGLKGHNGLDIVIYSGDPIIASHDGIVTVDTIDRYGAIWIEVFDGKEKYKTVYGHNLRNVFNVGDVVKRGDIIALGNNTGYSTGSHLHYTFKLTDNKGQTINKDNDYKGAIDPTPYLIDVDTNMTLTKKEVKILYTLWGKIGEEGAEDALDFWEGRTLEQLLAVRVKDFKSELKNL